MRWVSGAPTRAARRTFRGENVHVWKGGGSVKRREEKWGKGRKGGRKDRETRKKNEWRWIAVFSLFSFVLLLFFSFHNFFIFVYFLSLIFFSFLGNKCREKNKHFGDNHSCNEMYESCRFNNNSRYFFHFIYTFVLWRNICIKIPSSRYKFKFRYHCILFFLHIYEVGYKIYNIKNGFRGKWW